MEIMQMHYFKAVAKHESFTKAAEELHLTQSALSRSIAQLEDDIGLPLFQRKKGGGITLNSNGQFFLEHVIRILNSLENAVAATKEIAGGERGAVHIAVTETIDLTPVLQLFLIEHRNVHMTCRLQSVSQIRQGLEDGVLHFAVCNGPVTGNDLLWTPLRRDRLTVVLNGTHPLARREGLYLRELAQEHFIMSNVGYGMDSEYVAMCRVAGFEPYITYEGAGQNLCGQLVEQGVGVMLAPQSISRVLHVTQKSMMGIAVLPILDEFTSSEIGLVQRSGQFISEAANLLKQQILAFYKTLGG